MVCHHIETQNAQKRLTEVQRKTMIIRSRIKKKKTCRKKKIEKNKLKAFYVNIGA